MSFELKGHPVAGKYSNVPPPPPTTIEFGEAMLEAPIWVIGTLGWFQRGGLKLTWNFQGWFKNM